MRQSGRLPLGIGSSAVTIPSTGSLLLGVGVGVALLVGAELVVGWSLVGTPLVGASLVGTPLVGTTLVGASLVGTSLVGASLVGASLVGGALLPGSLGLTVGVGEASVALGVGSAEGCAPVVGSGRPGGEA